MRSLLKIIPIFIFAACGAFAFSFNNKSVLKAHPVAVAAAETENPTAPRDLYIRNCARCHGADGKSQNELGQTLEATDLTVRKASTKRAVAVITKGAGAMPGFGKKLKKSEIAALAKYIRSL